MRGTSKDGGPTLAPPLGQHLAAPSTPDTASRARREARVDRAQDCLLLRLRYSGRLYNEV